MAAGPGAELPPDTARTTDPRGDSGAVSRGDFVRYINGDGVERLAQVHTKGPASLDSALDLVVVTWDALGAPIARIISATASARQAGGPPYWTP